MKIGFGYDVHRLAAGRKLILGGVTVPFEKGLLGHSDADVLLHAVIDALIGAAGLGDIGKHFPPSDQKYKDASSIELLRKTVDMIEEKGFIVYNVDSTIVCEAPRLAEHIPAMAKNIAECAGCPVEMINVKAKTEEGLGFTGSGEGVSAYAVALLEEKQ